MKTRQIHWHRLFVWAYDVAMVPLATLVAILFRFDGGFYNTGQYLHALLALFVTAYGASFLVFGVPRGLWRFTSLKDLIVILKATSVGFLAILAVLFVARYADLFEGLSRSVVILSWLFLVLLMGGSRIAVRLIRQHSWLQSEPERAVAILGAGQAGRALVEQIQNDPSLRMEVLFVLDDKKSLRGATVAGVPVRGALSDLPRLLQTHDLDEVLVAIARIDHHHLKQVLETCQEAGVACRTLPSIAELVDGRVEIARLRPLSIEDILGREPIELDERAIQGYLKGKRVLVSGGGGSIGSELCRQVAGQEPELLIVLEHSEFNLYQIEQELIRRFPKIPLLPILGDVKDAEQIEALFGAERPQVIFHAAAYKHVPMVESNVAIGVRNNVTGTQVLADAADRHGVERFVLVSTDKAVNPTNVMGTTKRIAELYCQNLNGRSKTRFVTTRFGNVLGSAGSVVPLFQKQIEAGGPVTVTHPEITRYFMTIPEAVALILQAGSMGQGGEIFVLDMGEPIKIRDLAEQMIRLSGLEPERDIAIAYTGLRPGEKLFEELFHEQEALQGTTHPKLMLAAARQVDWGWLRQELQLLDEAAARRDEPEIRDHLQRIVPESRVAAGKPPQSGEEQAPLHVVRKG